MTTVGVSEVTIRIWEVRGEWNSTWYLEIGLGVYDRFQIKAALTPGPPTQTAWAAVLRQDRGASVTLAGGQVRLATSEDYTGGLWIHQEGSLAGGPFRSKFFVQYPGELLRALERCLGEARGAGYADGH
jgi:hypothetical protein